MGVDVRHPREHEPGGEHEEDGGEHRPDPDLPHACHPSLHVVVTFDRLEGRTVPGVATPGAEHCKPANQN